MSLKRNLGSMLRSFAKEDKGDFHCWVVFISGNIVSL